MGDVQRLFDIVDDLRRKADVKAAFGKPVTAEGRTLIPVAEVGYGFGLRFGTTPADEEPADEGGRSGSGGGAVRARPLGMVEVTAEGVRVEPLVDEQKVTLALVALGAWLVFWITRTLVRLFGQK
jgi:uncharacterized spore protein YtfJ